MDRLDNLTLIETVLIFKTLYLFIQACRKLSIELNPVDRISDNVVTSKRRRFVVTLASSVLLISASVVIVYVASKRGGKS